MDLKRRYTMGVIGRIVIGHLLLGRASPGEGPTLIPQIDGEWWTIAGNPDLGPLTSPKQQPVDFAVWPAADGTWQLWSCIRSTKERGHTRLFYHWEGKQL